MTPAAVIAGEARWAVVHGDCLDVLPTLEARSVAHVITDPPYEAEAHTLGRRVKSGPPGSNYGEGDDRTVEGRPLGFEPITEAQRDSIGGEAARLAARWTIVFCQVEAAMKWRAAVCRDDRAFRRIGVWVKPDAMPQLTGDRPAMGYESILFAHRPGRSRWSGGGRSSVFVHNKGEPTTPRVHTTQKPLSLMLELVELFTDPGDVILDAFCGSGTTGVAALRLGRRFIGIEKDATYAAVARERLEAESRGLSLTAHRAGQLPMFGT